MKITIVLLAVVVCFVAVNAAPSEQPKRDDLYIDELYTDEVFGDEMFNMDFYNIFSPFYWYLKAALRTLKGVNCSIKGVIGIENEAGVFLQSIQYCGTDAIGAFTNVIASVNNVISTCGNIINLNENVCNSDESTNGNGKTPRACVRKLFGQLYLLRNQINKTLQAVKKVPAVPGDAVYCTNSAANTLVNYFTSFPSNVKSCSKLVN